MLNLELIGADARLRAAFEPYRGPGLELARVAMAQRDLYHLFTDSGERSAEASGALWYGTADASSMPTVGDWVAARIVNREQAIVEAVLPRRSLFRRRAPGKREESQSIAANIDRVFVVCGLDGDFNLRRVERYLTLAAEAGVEAVIALNKTDVCPDSAARVREVSSITDGPVISFSALARDGVAPLRPFLESSPTVALLGSSGAGKSTIANALLGEQRLRTGAVRESDNGGRHTTTHRELIPLPGGGALIDTPGMRELQLWASAESVNEVFDEIAALAARCRFADCSHTTEPDCAVAMALASGLLEAARWNSYCKLRAEAHRHEALADAQIASEDKRKLKRLMRDIKRMYQSRR